MFLSFLNCSLPLTAAAVYGLHFPDPWYFRMAQCCPPELGPHSGRAFPGTFGEPIPSLPRLLGSHLGVLAGLSLLPPSVSDCHGAAPFPSLSRLQYALLAPDSLPVGNFSVASNGNWVCSKKKMF